MIGGFRSDLSITRKTDGNFGNVSAGVLFSKVAHQRKLCRFVADKNKPKKSDVLGEINIEIENMWSSK